jgi:HK97 family phage prohead protease
MSRRIRTFPLHLREVTEQGQFTGYASVFDVLDHYGDVIKPGAFTKTLQAWKERGRLPPLLWQHKSDQPIGHHLEMTEDAKGLFVRGQLLHEVIDKAREAYWLLKNKVISGMSIGFDLYPGGATYDGKAGVWNLTEVDLWENSLATFPANPEAQVEEVKSVLALGKLPAPSDFEGFLREAGFTRKQAKLIAAKGYTSLRDAGLPLRDAEDDDDPATTKSAPALDLSPLSDYLRERKQA